MKCKYCGHDNEKDSNFCINCGKILGKKEDKKNIEDILFVPQKEKNHTLRNIILVLGVVGVLGLLVIIFSDSSSTPSTDTPNTTNSTPAAPSGWQAFNSVEHGFSVNFPKYPTTDRIPEDKSGGISYSGTQYTSAPDDKNAYLVQAADYDVAPENYDNKTGLEGIVNGLSGGFEGKVTSSAFTTFQGYDAVNFSLTTKDGYFGKGVAFIKNDLSKIKAFILLKLSTDNDQSTYDNFINSFKLN